MVNVFSPMELISTHFDKLNHFGFDQYNKNLKNFKNFNFDLEAREVNSPNKHYHEEPMHEMPMQKMPESMQKMPESMQKMPEPVHKMSVSMQKMPESLHKMLMQKNSHQKSQSLSHKKSTLTYKKRQQHPYYGKWTTYKNELNLYIKWFLQINIVSPKKCDKGAF